MLTTLLTLSLALAPLPADVVGSRLPSVPIEGLTQTPATSFEEYTGRLVLIEYFDYW